MEPHGGRYPTSKSPSQTSNNKDPSCLVFAGKAKRNQPLWGPIRFPREPPACYVSPIMHAHTKGNNHTRTHRPQRRLASLCRRHAVFHGHLLSDVSETKAPDLPLDRLDALHGGPLAQIGSVKSLGVSMGPFVQAQRVV